MVYCFALTCIIRVLEHLSGTSGQNLKDTAVVLHCSVCLTVKMILIQQENEMKKNNLWPVLCWIQVQLSSMCFSTDIYSWMIIVRKLS